MRQDIVPDPRRVGELYDQIDNKGVLHFGYWDSLDDDTPLEQAADRLTDVVAEKLELVPGASLLDVGCGLGVPALRIAARAEVGIVGITVSAEQVRRAGELATAAGLGDRVRFELTDAMAMPFANGSFDAAFALESLIHMDRRAALREIARVVRPGGRIVLTDLYDRTGGTAGEDSMIHVLARLWLMSPLIGRNDYLSLAAGAGLEVVEVLDVSENVLWKTLQQLGERMTAGDRSLVPDVVVDGLDDQRRTEMTTAPAVLGGERDIGCLLVTLRRP
ncbi:SAM-dependent methyltransferase [Plantactinospora endophytica]|uniref:Methyltransferase type 11 n=1 Tax=Plantactinospora endophytica TaxID=673535 RepID=A0ABQ4E263_9ACTN|nr:methyltransferase domain-containing protein [Plantactinospora endophytica]GIG88778.1 methyltransferase type 11 [Plantactinospora endophytica]